ncbi:MULTISPECIES: hypothetical protein [Acinetobacter]|uniref:Uncharacterized protein n=1 Tax=Acinetobacter ursingii TaxID=108980 RepID=A0A7T9UHG9_9GAMM|nr:MULTISPECIES: hypothetical protein [Acinetobacter]ENX48764.1 hypothetical protein F943_02301 [Acinetobacter ursingii NIPH 706]EXD37905.1 hypothetical protein J500_0366 [Acinetobacter sp. 479375]MCH2014699.1 hypothetical protein [Acinetobacter ursingii]MCU4522568.1 hypothetical protein [Acinetobacter ursingii]MCU4587411.1 hypothetical protein [Acinetobacter ursingii]
MNYSISTAVASTIDALDAGHEIYSKIADAMDSIEQQGSTLSGTEKKTWVLEYAAKEIAEVLDNLDYWIPKIKQWIDIFKAAFNALKALF